MSENFDIDFIKFTTYVIKIFLENTRKFSEILKLI